MLYFDIETNGLLDTTDKIHCICTYDFATKKATNYDPSCISNGLKALQKADILVGHNIIGFDIPAIKKITGIDLMDKVCLDTLNIARLKFPHIFDLDLYHYRLENFKLRGKHSLKAWGTRLKCYKGTFGETTDWKYYTPKMLEYCAQDVQVGIRLFEYLKVDKLDSRSVALEHDFQKIITRQEQEGCPFDLQKAETLLVQLKTDKIQVSQRIKQLIPDKMIEENFIPKVNNITRGYKKGEVFVKRKAWVFNPGSRLQIGKYLIDKYKWEPIDFTTTGLPEVSEDVLDALPYEEAALFSQYLQTEKVLGFLSNGKNSWLKLVQPDGRIHGRVITNGAITGRCTHFNPNMAQIPSVRAYKGKECRELFYAPEGKRFVGGDASGLELRCLAHYLHPYDNGEYAKVILEGDIHTFNQKAAGLETRDKAKTFIYAFIYGAGNEKLGFITAPTASITAQEAIGKRLRAKFYSSIPALERLTNDVKSTFKTRGYLVGLDGRHLYPRAQHSALNTLLQSAGAIIMKKATCIFWDRVKEAGLLENIKPALHVHDEWQVISDEKWADTTGRKIPLAIKEAGEYFSFNIPLTGEYKVGQNWAQTH